MKKTSLKLARRMPATAALLACATALAHDGHGLGGAHWHATDTWGFLGVAVLAALAVWSSRDQ